VKYIALIEVDPENSKEIMGVHRKRLESKRQVRALFPPHTIAKTSSGFLTFVIFESEDEMEIAEYVGSYTQAGAKVKVFPIWETTKGFEVLSELK